MTQFIALGVRDVRRVDHRTAVNLPENLLVQLFEQFPQRAADDAVALAGRHGDVLILSLEPQHFIDWNQFDGSARARPHEAQFVFARSAAQELRDFYLEMTGDSVAEKFQMGVPA